MRSSTGAASLLRRPGRFRRLLASHVVSLVGDEVSLIAIPLVAVLALHASPAQMGLLAAAAGAPMLLLPLHVGAWIDRVGRARESMIAADLGRALLTAWIPIGWALGALDAWHLYAVAFLTGALGVASSVAHSTVFVSLVPRSLYLEANSLIQGGRAFSRALGAGFGGVLVQALTAPVAVFVDAMSFLASALLVAGTPAPRRETAPSVPPGPPVTRYSVGAGVAWIVRHAVVRSSLAAVATINFFLFGFYALFVLYATRTLGLRAPALGLVAGGAAVGAICGSAATARISRRVGIGPAFTAGCVAFPAPLMVVAALPAATSRTTVVPLLFAAQFASGFGLMLLEVTGGTIRTALIPTEVRARVVGAHALINKGARPLGGLIGGLGGSAIGIRPTIALATIGATAAVLWLIPSPLPRMRTLPAKTAT